MVYILIITVCLIFLAIMRKPAYRLIRRMLWGWHDRHMDWHRMHNHDIDKMRDGIELLTGMQVLHKEHGKQVREFVSFQMDINKGLLKKGVLTNEQYNDVKKRAEGIQCT